MGFQGKNLGQQYSLLAPYLEDLRNEKSKKEKFSNDRERIRKEILVYNKVSLKSISHLKKIKLKVFFLRSFL